MALDQLVAYNLAANTKIPWFSRLLLKILDNFGISDILFLSDLGGFLTLFVGGLDWVFGKS